MSTLTLGTVVFVVTYALIATERVNKTAAALAGGLTMILLNLLTQEQAFEHTDFNVIFLLAGMMMLANLIQRTGVFGWMAVQVARAARGRPYRILVLLSVFTAVASAFLDNVTTVLLIAPVTVLLARELRMNPVPYLISEIFASNIGGTATLIGDPPNILIGSAAGLDFTAFLLNLTPITLILLGVYLAAARWLFREDMVLHEAGRQAMLQMSTEGLITDRPLLVKSLAVLGLTLIGFILHGALGYEPATVALAGATLLMLVARVDPHEVLREVEWTTLFFFFGLFVLVGGVIEVGLIDVLVKAALALTGGAAAPTAMLVLWLSAVLSAVIDNIPYTATVVPVVKELSSGGGGEVLWWALALGADLGGNATIIGASANVIVAGIAEEEDHPIGFGEFLKYGIPVTLGTMLLSSLYLWLRYLL